MTRAEIIADLDRHGARLDGGLAFHTDADLEQAHAMWLRSGSPRDVVIGISHGDDGMARPWIDCAPPCQEESAVDFASLLTQGG